MRDRQRKTAAFALALVLFVVVVVQASRTDLSEIDLAGHLSSATQFRRGLFHQHEDAHFLGAIHGLFYPPLEDVLLGGMLAVGERLGAHPTATFRVYLALAGGVYLAAFGALLASLRTWRGFAVFALVFLTHFGMSVSGLLFQGLRLGDLVHIGLTAQFLGGAAFFVLVRELWERRRAAVIAATVTVAVLSHIVVGMVAVALVLPHLLDRRERRPLFFALVVAGGLSAVFWAPFVAHGSWIIKNYAVSGQLAYGTLAATIWLVVSAMVARSPPRLVRWLAAPAILLCAATAANLMVRLGAKPPNFHFYRFEALGVLLLGVMAARQQDELGARSAEASTADPTRGPSMARRLVAASAPWLVLVGFAFDTRGRVYEPVESKDRVEGFDPGPLTRPTEPYGRLLVIENKRSFEFGIESLLTTDHADLRVAKGLFWESSPSNNLLSSFLALLAGPPSMLAHVEIEPKEGDRAACDLAECLYDHMFADFDVRWIAVERTFVANAWWGARCFHTAWANRKTAGFTFEPTGTFSYGRRDFDLARVVVAEGATALRLTNNAVEVVAPQSVTPLTSVAGREYEHYFAQVVTSCGDMRSGNAARRVALVAKADLPKIPSDPSDLAPAPSPSADTSPVEPALVRISTGVFRLEAPRGTRRLYRVKLNPLPGLTLTDESGARLPWLRGYPHFFVVASGPVVVRFERTPAMQVGYGLTSLTVLALFAYLAHRAWARRRAT